MALLLLGHRGARQYAPENTVAAFDLALAHGCDGFEFDVRLSSDLHPVIVHDPRLDDVVIADFTAERIFALHDTIPPMWQVFERYASSAYLNIELKVVGLENRVADLLEVYPPQKGFMVSSFLPEAIRAMHSLAPEIPLGYISRREDLMHFWRDLPVTHVVLHHTLITASVAADLKRENKKLFAWTVNSAETMRELADLGVDAIISDDTRLLRDVVRGRGSAVSMR
jgi:glycerophosphoryl diester phosphodiesterase